MGTDKDGLAHVSQFPEDFHFAAGTLDTFMGSLNTLILLTSSLTMVLAVAHLERKNRKYAAIFVSATMLMGASKIVKRNRADPLCARPHA